MSDFDIAWIIITLSSVGISGIIILINIIYNKIKDYYYNKFIKKGE